MKIEDEIRQDILHMTILNLDISKPVQMWDIKSKYRTIERLDIEKEIPVSCYDNLALNFIDKPDIEKEMEIFVDVKGFDRYKISTTGRIYSKAVNKILQPGLKDNYLHICVYDNAKRRHGFFVHQLVAQNFVINPNPETHKLIYHQNANKLDNRASNLRYVTAQMNSQHYHDNAESRPVLQYDLDKNLIKEWKSITEIVKENPSLKRHQIIVALGGKNDNKYKNYIWQYKDPKIKPQIVIKEDEVFKNVGTLDGKNFSSYEVSNYGAIRNTKTNKHLQPAVSSTGYHKVILCEKNTKEKYNMKVHRIVAELFCEGKSEDKNNINHKNSDKLDNSAANLEWISQRDSIIHATGKKVNQIDIETNKIIKTFDSIADAQRAVGCANSAQISDVCRGRKRSCRGFKWAYAEN